MAAADTNLLVRLLVADDPAQLVRARRTLREQGPLFVTQVALVETVWVLSHTYGIARRELYEVIARLLEGAEFVVQREEEVSLALAAFRSSRADFADCLIIEGARASEQLPLLTFDKALARLDGAFAI